jgi:hypothetical protein
MILTCDNIGLVSLLVFLLFKLKPMESFKVIFCTFVFQETGSSEKEDDHWTQQLNV